MKNRPGRNRSPLRHLASAAALVSAFSLPAFGQQKKVKVFAFYPSFDLTPALTNNQMDGITHAVYFSVKMPVDGRLTEAYVSSQTNTQKLVDIVNRGNSRGVKTLLAIGGWELSAEFPGVANDPARRQAFAQTARDLCVNNGLAGIDIDWEFPYGNPNLALLLDAINATFKPANLTLTMSVNGEAPQYYGSAALNKVDYVLIMAYDMGTPHSDYNDATTALAAYKSQVTQASKLVLGVPFYGKSGGATRTYAELLQMNPSMSPATNDYGGYNFNGPDLIRQKAAYIVDQGGGGTMIWQISQDAVNTANPKGVLLTAMNAGFTSRSAVLDKAPVSIRPLLSRNHAGSALTWEYGGFRLPGASLASGGSYRLTLLAADGKTLASALSRPSGDGLRWSIDQSHRQPFFYRVDGVSGTISAGPVEGR